MIPICLTPDLGAFFRGVVTVEKKLAEGGLDDFQPVVIPSPSL